jgi:hypothetical protein
MYECDTIAESDPLSRFDEPRQWLSELDESEILTYEESDNVELYQ